MAKLDDVLKAMILYHGKRIAKEVLGNLPAQLKQTRYDLRSLQKDVSRVIREMGQLREAARKKAPVLAVSEEEVEKARFTKRTLPALQKRFNLTQRELAKLLQVEPQAINTWQHGKKQPRAENVAKIAALRSMSQKEVNAALDRQDALPAMSAQQIRNLRNKLSLSQEELAEHLGVSPWAVRSWERGKSVPGPHNREALERMKSMSQRERDELAKQKSIRRAARVPAQQAGLSPEEIVTIRKRAGLSQKGLADALGVSSNSISNWEAGSTSPRSESVRKLLAMRK